MGRRLGPASARYDGRNRFPARLSRRRHRRGKRRNPRVRLPPDEGKPVRTLGHPRHALPRPAVRPGPPRTRLRPGPLPPHLAQRQTGPGHLPRPRPAIRPLAPRPRRHRDRTPRPATAARLRFRPSLRHAGRDRRPRRRLAPLVRRGRDRPPVAHLRNHRGEPRRRPRPHLRRAPPARTRPGHRYTGHRPPLRCRERKLGGPVQTGCRRTLG